MLLDPKEKNEILKTIQEAEDYHNAMQLIKTLDDEYTQCLKRKPIMETWQRAVTDYFAGNGSQLIEQGG